MKSLVRFRSVSKPWKSLIESSEFIKNYHISNTQPDQYHLLVRFSDTQDSDISYVSILDDNHFPEHKIFPNAPLNVNLLKSSLILGSSHGLLCFYGFYRYRDYKTEMVLLWNPFIRKCVGIVVPNVLSVPYGYTVIGFGVCPSTSEPKLVKATHVNSSLGVNTVEIFTLSSSAWRSVSINLPRNSVILKHNQVVIDEVIYWKAYDKIIGRDGYYNLIISFDLTSEEFGEIYLPNCLRYSRAVLISKLTDSLVVLEYYQEAEIPVCGVWMMNHGVVPKSFTKLFTIKAPNSSGCNRVLGFRKNGKPIMETSVNSLGSSTLEVYDPSSNHIDDLGIRGNVSSFSVTSYTETLFLLDHPGSIIYC